MDGKEITPANIKEQALVDYRAGMKYKDIAAKYGVSLSAVKSWATRYWKNEKKLQPKSKVATKKVATLESNNVKKTAAAEDVDLVLDTDLTERQQLFCLYFIRYFNGTKAYMKAYPEASRSTARANSSKLLQDERITSQIRFLKQAKLNRALLDESDIFQMYLDIACADMHDYAEVKHGMVGLKDSENTDGMLIQELSQGKTGTKVKLYDRIKALEWLSEHMDLATTTQRLQLKKLEYELAQLPGSGDAQDNVQSFLKAIHPMAEDIKALYAEDGDDDEKEKEE